MVSIHPTNAGTNNINLDFVDNDDLTLHVQTLFLDVRTWNVEAMVEETISVSILSLQNLG